MTATHRFQIRLKPGSNSTSVGGTWGDDGALNVAVKERPHDGKANEAAIDLLATVLRVRKRQLSIVSGHSHRTKLMEISEPPSDVVDRIDRWRNKA